MGHKEKIVWGDWILPRDGRPNLGDYVQIEVRLRITKELVRREGIIIMSNRKVCKLAPRMNLGQRSMIIRWRKRVSIVGQEVEMAQDRKQPVTA